MAAAGMVVASQVPVAHGYPHLLIAMAMLSTGMGCIMAPATESIMGSLPRNKAGVGSAMNDTTRQVGGALGVAVIGSVLASFYRPAITSKVGALNVSPSVLSTARDSVGGAVQVGATLPAATGNALIAIAKTEFVHAFASALLVGGGIIAIAAVVVFVFLPARALDAREHVADATDSLASLAFAEAEGALEDATAFGSVTARTTSEFG
jgi:hypothetical protein